MTDLTKPERFMHVIADAQGTPPRKLWTAEFEGYHYVVETLPNGVVVEEYKTKQKAQNRFNRLK